MDRREFFGAVSSGGWIVNPCRAWPAVEARGIISSGSIGPVGFCRAAGPYWIAVARQVCGRGVLIGEVDAATSGAVFLGAFATLVVDHSGCRVLP